MYKPNQDPRFDLTADYSLTQNGRLTQLLDKYNLILTHGRVSQQNLDIIKKALMLMPLNNINGVFSNDNANRRIRIAIYLIMSSPDYVINK
jgi:hypothetical protein